MELETDNALLQKHYLEQHQTFTSGEIREASGLTTRNPSEPTGRLDPVERCVSNQ